MHIVRKTLEESYLTFYDSDGIVNTCNLTDRDPNLTLSSTTLEKKNSFLDDGLIKGFYNDQSVDWNTNFVEMS